MCNLEPQKYKIHPKKKFVIYLLYINPKRKN